MPHMTNERDLYLELVKILKLFPKVDILQISFLEQNLQITVRYRISLLSAKFVGCDRKFYSGNINQWPQKIVNMILHSHLGVCLKIG